MLEGIDLENYVCEGQMDIETLLRGARTMNNGIFNIRLSKIKHHPNNPRRNIGDVTELAESIRKNGIMQNLTVMHDPDDPEGYICLIGHRRMTAAAQAGLEEVPCRVVQIDEKEQIAMMLQENIQRNDLTIPEQAYGFQYMFDLGASADEIAEKTGLNRSTVYHRLNIAKLDRETLEAKAKDEDFQLTFKDLLELEKIEDIKERNRVFKSIKTRNELNYKVADAVRRQKMDKNARMLKKAMEAAGVGEAPEEYKKNRWSGKYKTLVNLWLDEDVEVPQIPKEGDKKFYDIDTNIFRLVIEDEKFKETETNNDWEVRSKKQNECKEKLEEFQKHMLGKMKRNVLLLVDDRLENVIPYAEAVNMLWNALMAIDAGIAMDDGAIFFLKKGQAWYQAKQEERKAALSDWNDLDMIQQMAILIYRNIKFKNTWDYSGKYIKGYASDIKTAFETFRETFGILLSKEEEAFLDGNSDMYYRDDDSDDDLDEYHDREEDEDEEEDDE